MTSAARTLANIYSNPYFHKLRKLLLPGTTASAEPAKQQLSENPIDFELDLEVVYDIEKRVEDIVIK